MAASASAIGLRDDDAFAGGEPIGLDDDGRAARMDIFLRGVGIAELRRRRGGDRIGGAEILGEALRAFELRGGLARPESLDAGFGQSIDQPGDERHLWPNDDEAHVHHPAEIDHRLRIRRIERNAACDRANAGIARRGIELAQEWTFGDLIGERMFAPAGADEKDVHVLLSLPDLHIDWPGSGAPSPHKP